MKISKLIEELTKVYTENGDVDCTLSGSIRVRDEDGDYALDSNCRYEYEYLYGLQINSVDMNSDGECEISLDDFPD